MEHVQRIDKETRRAGRRQCGGYLGTNVAALAHTGNNQFALAVQYNFYSFIKIAINQWYEVEQSFGLVFYTLNGSISPFAHDMVLEFGRVREGEVSPFSSA